MAVASCPVTEAVQEIPSRRVLLACLCSMWGLFGLWDITRTSGTFSKLRREYMCILTPACLAARSLPKPSLRVQRHRCFQNVLEMQSGDVYTQK